MLEFVYDEDTAWWQGVLYGEVMSLLVLKDDAKGYFIKWLSVKITTDQIRQMADKLDELNKSEIFHDAEGRN